MINSCLLYYTGVRLILFIAIKSLLIFENPLPTKAITVKQMLNSKCSGQSKFFNTPPHEHGNSGVNMSMYAMYKVKRLINNAANKSPSLLKFGKISKREIPISTMGIAHETKSLNSPIKGDLLSTYANDPRKIIFETAVYTNKNIKSADIISLKINFSRFDIAVNFIKNSRELCRTKVVIIPIP